MLKNQQRLWSMLAAALFACATPAHAQKARAPELRARLDSAIPAFMATGDVPGLEAAWIRDGKVYWLGAFGIRNATTGERVDPNTVFVAASLTKPLFAYVVLRLADKGIIDLDKPVASGVPFFGTSTDPRIGRITPRMLLSHSSGLPNCCGPEWALIGDPGSTWEYAPAGYDWLGALVEHATGMGLGAVARREVLEPLGMTHSALTWNDALEANSASPHTAWGVPAPQLRPSAENLENAAACCSLRTTAGDYAKFLIAVMDGRGLSARSAPLLLAPQVELINARSQYDKPESLRKRLAWALGFGVARTDSSNEFWQWGDYGNSKAFVIGDAKGRSAFVYFANAQTGLSIAGNIVSMVFPGEVYPITMLGYPSIDDVARLARRRIVRAALDSGAAGGVRRFDLERRRDAAHVGMQQVIEAAADLSAEHRLDAADTLLAVGQLLWPDSAAVPLARGDVQLSTGANGVRAAEYYGRALALTPGDSVTRARLQWAVTDTLAHAHPAVLGADAMQRLAGRYGPMLVSVKDGRLYYKRGNDDATELLAISPDTFILRSEPTRRVRFDLPRAASLTEITVGGTTRTIRQTVVASPNPR